jgi:hypothetical protein
MDSWNDHVSLKMERRIPMKFQATITGWGQMATDFLNPDCNFIIIFNEDAPPELYLSPSGFIVSLKGTITEYSCEILEWTFFGKYPEYIQTVMNGKPSRKLKWCKSYKKCFNLMMNGGKTRKASKNFKRLARMYRQADRRWGGRPVPPEWKEKE